MGGVRERGAANQFCRFVMVRVDSDSALRFTRHWPGTPTSVWVHPP